MSFGGKKILGISLGSRSLLLAELHGNGASPRVVRSGEMTFDDTDSLQIPAELGKKLSSFLKKNGFAASQCVIGMPAQWLMLKEKMLPPAAPEAIAGILRIQAERDFSLEPSSLAIDYALGRVSSEGQSLVLVAALRERIDQIRALATSAGLKLQMITGTSLALSAAAQSQTLLYIGANGAELATRSKDGLMRVRHISGASAGKSAVGAVLPELRRLLVLAQPPIDKSEIVLWDDSGEAANVSELSGELGVPVKVGKRLNAQLEMAAGENCAGSSALALCAFQPNLARVDFLHSRLEIKPPSKLTSTAIWSSVAAFVIVGGLGYLLNDWRASAADVAELRQRRDDMKENLDTAKTFINRVNATRTWYERRPNYLECLREITLTFPEEGRVWTTSLSLREDMRGILNGKASDEKSVLDVLDKLKAGKKFAEVKMLNMRGSGAKGGEIMFAVSFAFLGVE
jgi:hypothetical protein